MVGFLIDNLSSDEASFSKSSIKSSKSSIDKSSTDDCFCVEFLVHNLSTIWLSVMEWIVIYKNRGDFIFFQKLEIEYIIIVKLFCITLNLTLKEVGGPKWPYYIAMVGSTSQKLFT